MTERVGVFGGYEGRAIRWRPDRHGLLCMAVRGGPSSLALYWSFGPNARLELGELARPDGSAGSGTARVRGGITLEQEEGGARVLRSRAWPAVRWHQPAGPLQWRTSGTRLLACIAGRPEVVKMGERVSGLSEPWLVVFGHADAGEEDPAVLLTLTSRPEAIAFGSDGIAMEFGAKSAVHAMPLEGLRRRATGQPPIEHWIACARAWVAPLLAFPTGCDEVPEIAGDRVRVRTRFSLELLEDAWGNRASPLAPVPPSIALAAAGGYPVTLPEALVADSAQLNVPTYYGPFVFVRGSEHVYALDAPVGPAIARVRSTEAWTAPIREELTRIVDAVDQPADDYLDNDLRVVAFLGEAWPELDGRQRARARLYMEKALTKALRPLHETREPLSGQAWWTIAKTWRSRFRPDDPPWARDQERFDSEYYNGQAVSAIAAAARIDPSLARAFLDDARRLDTYGRIFCDWATGSVLTHATGDSANIDGVEFAFEGTIAAAELARGAGDEAWHLDATHRAARQQAALYAMWCHAEWVRQCDYAVGHVSKARIAAAAVETLGPIDAFVAEYGAATLEYRSFWQCTSFLYYANRPLFELYRRYGLLERIRRLEYEVMPALHPRWHDGHAVDPFGENGQERYGTAWTAAHLAARAALFGDDPLELFAIYEDSKRTPAAETWYRMQLPQIAGPLLLTLLEAPDPGAGAARSDPAARAPAG